MKQKTMIAAAHKLYRDAMADYCRIVMDTPVIPQIPHIDWVQGQGWVIDGELDTRPAREIVNYYQQRADMLYEDIKTFRAERNRSGKRKRAGAKATPGERSGTSQEWLAEAEREA